MLPLVLASSSVYRRQLLQKLNLSFVWASPEVDETPLPDEQPRDMAIRLACSKAQALAGQFPRSLIIGSDQVCSFAGQLLGKPGTSARARLQLQQLRSNQVCFYTGLCLLNTATGRQQQLADEFRVVFRNLSNAQIDYYLQQEQPYDCAGSFKSEGLGICLFERLQGDDPNSLVGLPLIQLCRLLANEGLDVLNPHIQT